MTWVKGQSGNPAGRPRKFITEKLIAMLQDASHEPDGQPRVLKMIRALIEKAETGDVTAAREVMDRCEGKAVQVLAGDPDNPVPLAVIERVLVDPQVKT